MTAVAVSTLGLAQAPLQLDANGQFGATVPAPDGDVYLSALDVRYRVRPDGSCAWAQRVVAPGGAYAWTHRTGDLCTGADGQLWSIGAERVATDTGLVIEVSCLRIGVDGTLLGQSALVRTPQQSMEGATIRPGSVEMDGVGGIFAVIHDPGTGGSQVVKFQDGLPQWWVILPAGDVGSGVSQHVESDGVGGCYVLVRGGAPIHVQHLGPDGSLLFDKALDCPGCSTAPIAFDIDRTPSGGVRITGAYGTDGLGSGCLLMDLDADGELGTPRFIGPVDPAVYWTGSVQLDGSFVTVSAQGGYIHLSANDQLIEAYRTVLPQQQGTTIDVGWNVLSQAGDRTVWSGVRRVVDQTWGVESSYSLLTGIAGGDLASLCDLAVVEPAVIDLPDGMFIVQDAGGATTPFAYTSSVGQYALESTAQIAMTPACAQSGYQGSDAEGWSLVPDGSGYLVTGAIGGWIGCMDATGRMVMPPAPIRSGDHIRTDHLPGGAYHMRVWGPDGSTRVSTRFVRIGR